MKHDEQTSRAFYRHAESGQIVVIERRRDGTILGSCRATEPLKDLDSYTVTDKNDLWLPDQSDKLMLMEQGREYGQV